MSNDRKMISPNMARVHAERVSIGRRTGIHGQIYIKICHGCLSFVNLQGVRNTLSQPLTATRYSFSSIVVHTANLRVQLYKTTISESLILRSLVCFYS
jgi:hypothetical protein